MNRIALTVLTLLALAAPARAAPVDMNIQTCQDWLDAGEDEQDQMVAWLRGYLAGRSVGALFDQSRLRTDASILKQFCQGHTSVGLVSAGAQLGR